jgi:phenazine biosynthesis protein phzF
MLQLLNYAVVDAFTSEPLRGNPVAVFLDPGNLSCELMQMIAAEMRLSETVFVLSGNNIVDATARIFTPVNELPYAGHPILGTAAALYYATGKKNLALQTKQCVINCEIDSKADNNRCVEVSMTQPVPTWQSFDYELASILGVERSELPVDVYNNGPRHVIFTLPSVKTLMEVQPDYHKLATLQNVAINCVAGSGGIWHSRMFSPAYGVIEDAATGSAAGPICIHLARYGMIDKQETIEIYQGARMKNRARIRSKVAWHKDVPIDVSVSGNAIQTIQGFLSL